MAKHQAPATAFNSVGHLYPDGVLANRQGQQLRFLCPLSFTDPAFVSIRGATAGSEEQN